MAPDLLHFASTAPGLKPGYLRQRYWRLVKRGVDTISGHFPSRCVSLSKQGVLEGLFRVTLIWHCAGDLDCKPHIAPHRAKQINQELRHLYVPMFTPCLKQFTDNRKLTELGALQMHHSCQLSGSMHSCCYTEESRSYTIMNGCQSQSKPMNWLSKSPAHDRLQLQLSLSAGHLQCSRSTALLSTVAIMASLSAL